MSFCKELITSLIYFMSESFNSYIVTYVIFGAIMAFISFIYRVFKSKNDHLCDKFAPYVKAIQSDVEDSSQRDKLLGDLYSVNHYNTIPTLVIYIVNFFLILVVYSSLAMITNEGRNIPVEFLWVKDVSAKVSDVPMILIYCATCFLSNILIMIVQKKFTAGKLGMGFLSFALSIVTMSIISRWFSALLIIYLMTRHIVSVVLNISYIKLKKPYPEIIVPDELEAIFQKSLAQNNNKEGEKL